MDETRGIKMQPSLLIFVLLCAFVLFCSPTYAGAGEIEAQSDLQTNPQSENVTLDAERVSYDDETGRATAEGDAVLTYQGATIRAERIDYDAATQKVKASPLPGRSVVLQGAGKTVTGDGLEYDLNTGEGVLTGAKSSLPIGEGTLYISGGGVEVIPYALAVERKLVKASKSDETSYMAQWQDVSATTCAQEHPHYRIETKRITFVPGRRVVAKKPRVYLGDTYIFTYPMDYIVQIERKALKYSILPYAQNSSSKGTGGGISGALAWDTGTLSLGAAYWSNIDFEWMAEINQSLGAGFAVKAGLEYSWDEPWDEKIYRPYAALSYEHKGWEAVLNWTQNEYIEDQKDSLYKYKGRLDRKPEFIVTSPWLKDRALQISWFRFGLNWGSYREETPMFKNNTIMRYGAQVQSYVEIPLSGVVEVFSNNRYGAWFYDENNADQQAIESFWGLRYKLGVVELGSGYERRYVWGQSPMFWDSYRGAEKIHQKIRFPLGKELYAAVRGSYDLNESMVDEVNYGLQWINDCMRWELQYRDDRTSGGENKVNLNVSLLAFPNTPASFGQYKDTDPFERPEGLTRE